MQLRAVTALIAFGGLAACGSSGQPTDSNGIALNTAAMNEQQLAQAEHRPPNPDAVMAQRWQALFTQPDKLVAALNDMGYKVGGYGPAAGGSGYSATGQEQNLPDDEANPPATVKTNVVATGDAAGQVQKIVLTFDTHVSSDPQSPRVSDILGFPRQIVNGVLQRFELNPGDPAVYALTQFDSATSSESGGTVKVEATPGKAAGKTADQHIVVTITPAGVAGTGA